MSDRAASLFYKLQSHGALTDAEIEEIGVLLSRPTTTIPVQPVIMPVKLNDPQVFTGTTKGKGKTNNLENFITQVNMAIAYQPERFPNEKTKVFYACSFMTDLAFEWAQPFLATNNTDHEEACLNDYNIFLQALRVMFADVNAVADAQQQLLTIKQGDRTASEYVAEFKRLAITSKFNDAALATIFMNGLNFRVSNELILKDLPAYGPSLYAAAIQLDAKFNFQRHSGGYRSQSKHHHHHQDYHNRDNYHHNYHHYNNYDKHSPRAVHSGAGPMEVDATSAEKKFKPLSNKEKQKRRDEGLCLYCGSSGHLLDSCPKKSVKKVLGATSSPSLVSPTKGNSNIFTFNDYQNYLQAQGNQKPLSPIINKVSSLSLYATSLISDTFDAAEHIVIDVVLKIKDKTIHTVAMLDSGAMSNFIDIEFCLNNQLTLDKKNNPIEILTVDGSPISSGRVTHDVKSHLTIGPHKEDITLDVTKLGQYPVILGMPWFTKHDPYIIWSKHQVIFNSKLCTEDCLIHVPKSFSNISIVSAATILEDIQNTEYGWIDVSKLKDEDSLSSEAILLYSSTSQVNTKIEKTKSVIIPEKYNHLIDVFSKKKSDTLPPRRPCDHKIILEEGKTPPFGPIYPLNQAELKELSDYLKENLAKGFIRKSTSPCGAPVLFAKKKDGSLRLCIDSRGLNKITVRDRTALPLIKEMIDRLTSAKYFTKLDIRNAYYRIRIAEGDEWKTAFRTRYGHFEYNVLSFGLTNSPSTFMAFINEVLREYLDVFCICYLDDILIYTDGDLELHTSQVELVLKKLLDAELYVKAEKCEFDVKEVEFLGYRIGVNGVSMCQEKVKAITEWPVPKSVHDIQVFLGFANFYRSFIFNYSLLTLPLTNLLKKNVRGFVWEEKEDLAFKKLKQAFSTKPILKIFSPEKQSVLETDASDFAIAGVLSQLGDDGKLHPIAYYSRKLLPAEVNYEIYDKEMLGIVDCFLHWRQYLEGCNEKTLVLTDHKNLEYFLHTKQLNRRQARWSIKLSGYNFVIKYRTAKQNCRADALSRRPDLDFKEGEKQPIHTLLKPEQLLLSSTTSLGLDTQLIAEIFSKTKSDKELNYIYQVVQEPSSYPRTITKNTEDYKIDEQSKLLLFKSKFCIPNDDELKIKIVKQHHDSRSAGHFGRAKTYELISREFWWNGLKKFVNRYVANCQVCTRGKSSHQALLGHLKPLAIPHRPWSSISMDFIVSLPESSGFNCIWVVVDRLTKMCHFIPCQDTITAKELAQLFMIKIFKHHGLPDDIISDRGAIFNSKFWKQILSMLEIKPNMSTGFHPQTDGQTEKTNATLEQYLRMFVNYQQDNWSELLSHAEFSYNNHCQTSTNVSPFYANYGFHPKFKMDLSSLQNSTETVPASTEFVNKMKEIHDEMKAEITSAQIDQERFYNEKRRTTPQFKVGDQVYLSTKNINTERPMKKLDHKRVGPFKIIQRIGTHAYKLQLPKTMKIHPVFHVSLLTPKDIPDLPDINNRVSVPLPPIIVDNQEEYVVKEVVDSRWFHRKLQYKVKWEGYDDPAEDTWEDAKNLKNAPVAVKEFHSKYPDKPKPT